MTQSLEHHDRVLQIGPTRYRGGVAAAVGQLSEELCHLGYEVCLVGNGGDVQDRVSRAGARCETLALRKSVWSLIMDSRRLRRVFASFRPTFVHAHSRAASLVCCLAGRFPDWFTLHNEFLTERSGSYDRGLIRKYLSPLGRNCIALTSKAADYLVSELGMSRERIAVIPNGVDTRHFRPPTVFERRASRESLGVSEDQVLALFMGRFAVEVRRKGLEAVRFALVGDGPLYETIGEEILRLNLRPRCILRPWSDPREAYWAADIVLMPSRFEGFGLVAAEACACGCPVIRTRTGGHEFTTVDGYTGFVTDASTPVFVRRAVSVLSEPTTLAVMRENSRCWAEAKLSSVHAAQRVSEAYRASRLPRS